MFDCRFLFWSLVTIFVRLFFELLFILIADTVIPLTHLSTTLLLSQKIVFLSFGLIAYIILTFTSLWQTKTNAISWNPMEPINFTAVSLSNVSKQWFWSYCYLGFLLWLWSRILLRCLFCSYTCYFYSYLYSNWQISLPCRQMKMVTAIAMILERWMKPNVFTKITFLLCKMKFL